MRAHAMAAAATPEQHARLAAGLQHAAALTQLGAAEKTLEKDDLAWERWREFSEVYGFDPVVSREVAVNCPDLLASSDLP